MKKYLKFSNPADNVSRIGLEKLGFSTKRNDPNTIGQFGSGIKFAPIAALRRGLEWHFIGNDNNGQYHLQYCIQEEDGVNCVFYNYGDYVKPSSFTEDAGVLSWVNEFQIYREALANAADSGDGWTVTVVDEDALVYEDGVFSCFISASPELMNIHNDFDTYFTMNRNPLFTWTRGWDNRTYKVLNKIDSKFRVYSFGILVHTSDDPNVTSLFDFDIKALSLNEERNIKSQWEIEMEVCRLICTISDPDIQKKYFNAMLAVNADSYYEIGKISPSLWSGIGFNSTWSDTFFKIYGKNAIIYDKIGLTRGVKEFIEVRGYKAIYVESDFAYQMLEAIGIDTYVSISDETIKYNPDYDLEEYPNLIAALRIAKRFEPEFANIISSGRLGVYDGDKTTMGLTVNMNKPMNERIILIEETHTHESVENILATVMHEFDHLASGLPDGNLDGRAFRDLADSRMAKLMIKFYQESPAFIKDGLLHFNMSEMTRKNGFNATFSISKVNIINKVIVKVGKIAFIINGDALFDNQDITDTLNGIIAVSSSGIDFTIDGLTNVTEVELMNV